MNPKGSVTRGKQRDQQNGERSMGRAVAAFNALTGCELSEIFNSTIL